MPRPPVKKTEKLAEAEETGKLRAQRKAEKKKPFTQKLQEKLLAMVDRIDPFEAIAIAGTTVIIHNIILSIPTEKLTLGVIAEGPTLWDFIIFPGIGTALGQFSKQDIKTAEDVVKYLQSSKGVTWILSFILAFIAIRHGAEILSGVTNLGKWVFNMVGVLTP